LAIKVSMKQILASFSFWSIIVFLTARTPFDVRAVLCLIA